MKIRIRTLYIPFTKPKETLIFLSIFLVAALFYMRLSANMLSAYVNLATGDVSSLTDEVSSLEKTYFNMTKDITVEYAYKVGFIESADRVQYIPRARSAAFLAQ